MKAIRPVRLQVGFSLIEVCITVAIIALAAGVVIPSLRNITRTDLRSAARKTAALVSSAYDQAALGGQTYRLVLEPGTHQVQVEATEQAITFDSRGGALAQAQQQIPGDVFAPFAEAQAISDHEPREGQPGYKKESKKKDDKHEATPTKAGSGGALKALMNVNKVSAHAGTGGFSAKELVSFAEHVRILDVWTDGMDRPQTDGQAYLYFFPSGYTQDALIHLEDLDNRVFSVKVAALTGKCTIESGYVEVSP